jgi:alkylation response protein AidB-like acyl-CoA dehydrogenase
MNTFHSAEDVAFRDEVRAFLRDNLPPDLARKVLGHRTLVKADYMRWQDILGAKGWLVGHWPQEFGGHGWTPARIHIFDEEASLAGAPRVVPFGVNLVASVLIAFGTPAQRERYLTAIRTNKEWWCQGYSEPGAGSDLASLQTRADLSDDGTHYVVNGQKTWTTQAHYADMMFCLVRTSRETRKQEGITFLLIDMKSAGITVRPLLTLDEDHSVNDVFFDDVRVPLDNRIGEEGKGWTYAKFLLGFERTVVAGLGGSKRELASLKKIATTETRGGRPLAEDPHFAAKLALAEIELMALDMTVMRVLSDRGKAPGPEASILKIKGTELQQMLAELMMEAVGPYALPFVPRAFLLENVDEGLGQLHAAPLAARYFNSRKVSIFGGSNEIQRNIIAKAVLGL